MQITIDLEGDSTQGKHGFELMTDDNADADYLYSQQYNHFISLDTPRTAKAKGEYVITRGLGGAFSWSGDQDNGLLANAAREGMGYELDGVPTLSMSHLYNKGAIKNL